MLFQTFEVVLKIAIQKCLNLYFFHFFLVKNFTQPFISFFDIFPFVLFRTQVAQR